MIELNLTELDPAIFYNMNCNQIMRYESWNKAQYQKLHTTWEISNFLAFNQNDSCLIKFKGNLKIGVEKVNLNMSYQSLNVVL